jgi:hypothetical protein
VITERFYITDSKNGRLGFCHNGRQSIFNMAKATVLQRSFCIDLPVIIIIRFFFNARLLMWLKQSGKTKQGATDIYSKSVTFFTIFVNPAVVLRCGKQMEKLPHYHFSWIVSFQKHRYHVSRRKLSIALSGGIVSEEAVDLSSDRLLMMMMMMTTTYRIRATPMLSYILPNYHTVSWNIKTEMSKCICHEHTYI